MANSLKYTQGFPIHDTFHENWIEEISNYNSNYYRGFNTDLLYAKSDDNNTTRWYLVRNQEFIFLGESYCDENDILHIPNH